MMCKHKWDTIVKEFKSKEGRLFKAKKCLKCCKLKEVS